MRGLVVGFDMAPAGERAVWEALTVAGELGVPVVTVVHVVDQRALDETGRLDLAGKREAILDKMYPDLWRRLRKIGNTLPLGMPDGDVDVQVRFATGHLTKRDRTIAEHLRGAAVDYGADAIVIGRVGRPDGVGDTLVRHHGLARMAPDIDEPLQACFLAVASSDAGS